MKRARKIRRKKFAEAPLDWNLRLYVAGESAKSATAFRNLQMLCEEHLPGRYRIEVINLMKTPQLAQGDQILAIPAVVRKLPTPIRKIVGDLSNTEQVLVGLDLRCQSDIPSRSPEGALHV